MFGTATSAYQIEGHAHGGAGLTHWDSFASTPGNVVRAEHGQLACDHYHRFEQDLDLVAAAGLDTYRFSTSWARVMPEGRGPVNQEGLDFYDRPHGCDVGARIKARSDALSLGDAVRS
jgi:beta-glucosidase